MNRPYSRLSRSQASSSSASCFAKQNRSRSSPRPGRKNADPATAATPVAASERSYYEARVYAARYGLSLSAAVGFLLNNLPLISQAVKDLRAKDPNFGSDPARLPYGKRA